MSIGTGHSLFCECEQCRDDAFGEVGNDMTTKSQTDALAQPAPDRLLKLADRIDATKRSWLPISGHVVNVTFDLNEADAISASLRHAAGATNALAAQPPSTPISVCSEHQEPADGCQACGKPPAAPVEEERKTFTIPPGYEAVRDSEGRATGEVRPRSSAVTDRPAGFVKPDNDRQVFFYEQDCYVLSNFSAFNLRWKGARFATSEQAYHWEKFYETEPKVAWKVMNADSAHEAFKIAEQYKKCRRPDWDDVKVDIMRRIIRAKFDQHEYVRRKLLATGNRELIEDSWRDDFWGWGPNRDGKNMLGRLWMDLRNQMAAELDGGQR